MHTGGEKSISARDRVRDLRGMVGVARFTMNANSCHSTTHHPPQPAIRPHPFTDFNQLQLRQSFIKIVVPALRTGAVTPNRERHWAVAGSLVLPPICWVDYRDTRTTIPSYACMGLSCSTWGLPVYTALAASCKCTKKRFQQRVDSTPMCGVNVSSCAPPTRVLWLCGCP